MHPSPHHRPERLPESVPPAVAAALQQAADRAHAHMRMCKGITAALDYLDHHTDHRAPIDRNPIRGGTYNEFLHTARTSALKRAMTALPEATVSVRLIVPMWVHTLTTGTGHHDYSITIPLDPTAYRPPANVWTLYALAAADRTPSLLTLSWDWAAAFPAATPDADADIYLTEGIRECAPGPCESEQAA